MWSLHRRRRPVSPDLDAATVRAEMALFGLRKTRKEGAFKLGSETGRSRGKGE